MATAEKVAIRHAQAAEEQTAAVKALESDVKGLRKLLTAMDAKLDALLAAQEPPKDDKK